LEQNELAHALGFAFTSRNALAAELKELRDDPEIAPWLKEAPSQVLQQAMLDRVEGFKKFFEGETGFPRYARRHGKQGFRIPQHVRVRRVSRRWGEVRVPKLGWVRFRWAKAPVGEIRNATVTLDVDGHYHLCLCCRRRERHPQQKPLALDSIVGTDLGVECPVVTSDGRLFGFHSMTPKEAERLRRLERQRERQVKDSKNQQKTKAAIARLRGRGRRRRADFAEQVSNRLSTDYAGIVFEDVKVKNMTASAAGTVAEPGVNVAQKRALNRSILDVGWGAIRERTQQKAPRRGCCTDRVRPHYSSQECPLCHHTEAANHRIRSLFVCQACGFAAHVDVVGAINVKHRAIAKGLGGEGAVVALASMIASAASSSSPLQILGVAGGTPVAARQGPAPLDCCGPHVSLAGGEERGCSLMKREPEKGHRTVRVTDEGGGSTGLKAHDSSMILSSA
jgi:IS605 OrfB family transposase